MSALDPQARRLVAEWIREQVETQRDALEAAQSNETAMMIRGRLRQLRDMQAWAEPERSKATAPERRISQPPHY